jgi:hypothetical protein
VLFADDLRRIAGDCIIRDGKDRMPTPRDFRPGGLSRRLRDRLTFMKFLIQSIAGGNVGGAPW